MNRARRHVIIGLACLGTAGLAEIFRPRRYLDRLGPINLAKAIPREFGGWAALPDDDNVVPEQSDALAHMLYDQIMLRRYRDRAGHEVTLLIAHGPRQTEALQLHRPEACYQAFGYHLSAPGRSLVGRPAQGGLPLHHFTADLRNEQCTVSYWTRVGDSFPESAFDQRIAIMQSAVAGSIGDGMLGRVSNSIADSQSARALNIGFIAALMTAVYATNRAAFRGLWGGS